MNVQKIIDFKEQLKEECLKQCGLSQSKKRIEQIDGMINLEMNLSTLIFSIQSNNTKVIEYLLDQIEKHNFDPSNQTEKQKFKLLKQELEECILMVRSYFTLCNQSTDDK